MSLYIPSKVFAGTLSSDIDGIDDAKYPGVKSMIKNLQASNINFEFKIYYTGIDWNEALNREYQNHGGSPLNLFNLGPNYKGIWHCPICGAKSYDNGSLYCASKEAIGYMMDPRNSLTGDSVYQFKTLEVPDATIADITRIVGTKGAFINNPEAIQAIYDASVTYGINGYYLIAKIINEHGNNGSSLSNGTYEGFQGIRNYFNIGAYGNGTPAIINNGLTYARDKGWNSIRASILGGAEIVKNQYIGKGQNTLYYQKFNVVYEASLFSHQYQQNIMAAESQGRSLKSYYISTVNHTFIIPLFENMPSTASPRPDINTPNSYSYEEGIVTTNSLSLTIRALPNGTAIGKLNKGESIKILQRGTSLVAGKYWDIVVSNVDGTYGYAARGEGGTIYLTGNGTVITSTVGGGTTQIPGGQTQSHLTENNWSVEAPYINISPDMTIEKFRAIHASLYVTDASGNQVDSGTFSTGYRVNIDGTDYIIVKKGDVNGDGAVTITDIILTLNYATSSNISDQAKIKATQVKSSGGDTSVTDVILLLNYLK